MNRTTLKQVMGSISPWFWDESYAKLHPPADSFRLCDGEVEQTFGTFVNMGRREPNERGTGRWKLTAGRRTIKILPLDDGVPRTLVKTIQLYMGAFFHTLPVEIHDEREEAKPTIGCTKTQKKKKKKNEAIINYHMNSGIESVPLKTIMVDGHAHLEVFSLFDAIVSLVSETDYCVIGLTSKKLAEEWTEENGEDGIESLSCEAVLGRACGDRTCVVQTSECSLRTLLATCTHEVLHCFGLDHCVKFQCLMNSQSVEGEDCLFLSPLNLKKLVVGVLEIRDDEAAKNYVLERYAALKVVLQSLALFDEVKWLDSKIHAIRHAVSSETATTKKKRKQRDESNL